jgi:DNA-binding SARP family transcriptional activator
VTEFNLLGPFEVVDASKKLIPIAPKPRQVLALLLMRAGEVVNIEDIIEELWADDPPSSAVTTAQTYICHLRKRLGYLAALDNPPELATTVGPGYVLHMNDARCDAESFRQLHFLGQTLLAEGRASLAVQHLRAALECWRGMPLANLRPGRLLRAYAATIMEERTHTLELRIEADLQLGRHRELIGELRSLVLTHPVNEWFHARLIEALGRCGRRREALEVYNGLYVALYRDLGMVPSREVQDLQRAILEDGLVKSGDAVNGKAALSPASARG